jgi:hypothetical protein
MYALLLSQHTHEIVLSIFLKNPTSHKFEHTTTVADKISLSSDGIAKNYKKPSITLWTNQPQQHSQQDVKQDSK